jgi:flagellar assembly factor FliW
MSDGLIGFEDCRHFVLLEDRPDTAFRWMQSVDRPDVAFIVVNPADFFPNYEVELTEDQAGSLDLSDPAQAVMLTTVTMNLDDKKVTTNLLGPIVINLQSLTARQIVLQDDTYCTKHVIGEKALTEPIRELVAAA